MSHDTTDNKTIFQSPFLGPSSASMNIPKLLPPKKNVSSPMKRIHRRKNSRGAMELEALHSQTRQPLLFNKSSHGETFSILDDFQNQASSEPIDLFTPLLPPPTKLPQNATENRSDTPNKKMKHDVQDRSFFDIGFANQPEGGCSIFSMVPQIGTSRPFNFSSYLKSVTSQMNIPQETGNYKNTLLDFTHPTKIDITETNNGSLMDDLELDCVMRSNTWDSDVETEDELELDLNLQTETNDLSIESPNTGLQSLHSNSLKRPIDSNIPSLYDPYSNVFTTKRNSIIKARNNTTSGIPLKIHSDLNSKVRSSISSQESDETLNEDNHLKRGNSHHQVTIINDKHSKCLPHHHIFVENLKSAMKPIPSSLLNLIVESSDGSLDDATKYATEINAQNSNGIPIPEKTTEVVNIPTSGPAINGVRKSAIIKGFRAKANPSRRKQQSASAKPAIHNTLSERREALMNQSSSNQNINSNVTNFKGFYSLQEKQQFYKRNGMNTVDEGKENRHSHLGNSNIYEIKDPGTLNLNTSAFKRPRVGESFYVKEGINNKGQKKVYWADSLEW